ncbi:hypothetical protein SKA53_02206 [Yoonia vestfoldensis SKA53]|uniref:Uncharacterized protein n=1 Tax=Yoonia vestfoldensis SKA53 TaxID=314232 RepID=A3V3W4_9RHOB|nr:hypothetical protein SKA53_02206 [Yoonia vestfoldensis SKA53]
MVDRYFEIARAVVFGFGQVARAHVGLQRWQDQSGHAQLGIARGAHGHEIFQRFARADMDIHRLLFAHGGFPSEFIAAWGLVIVTHENPRVVGQGQDFLDRVIQILCRPAGEIAACGAEIGHEQRITHKGRIADHIGQAGGGVAGRVQHIRAQLADVECVCFIEQRIKLRSVALKSGPFVKDLAECVLHDGDVGPDPDLAAQMLLQIGGGGQVVGVDMAFEDPGNIQPLILDPGNNRIGRCRIGAACGGVVIQNAVNNRASVALWFAHNVGNRVGGFIEEGFDFGFHVDSPLWL